MGLLDTLRGEWPEEGFRAQFPGVCWECHEDFDKGARITAREDGGYRHVTCPESQREKPTRFQGTTLDEMGF